MKKLQFILPVIILITLSEESRSQSFTPALSIPVTVNGNQIINPWAGGLNSPQFSEIDLNNDGIEDLFVFEPFLPQRITTFINSGTPNQVDYHYAPQYISKFPAGMHDWVLLTDYNCDGKEDIFTYTYLGGVSVYKNVSVAGNLQFVLENPLLYSNYFGLTLNLFVSAFNLPALTDIDGDSDMDILSPAAASANYIDYHKNLSIDNYGICDSLIFIFDTTNFSWGGFGNINGNNQGRTLLAFDNDYDGDMDLLTVGDFSNSYLSYYQNIGTSQSANLILIDDSFPSYNIPVQVSHFPAPFYLDVNNDNKKDLLVSTFSSNSENIKNVQYYQNTAVTGVNTFNLVNHSFLVDNMIDVGAGANARFFDVDKDGLQDLIIGNYIRRELILPDTASLSYYRNTGTAANPAFQFITNNFANTNSTVETGLAPCFGDLDGDGDVDMLIGYQSGNITFYTNTAGAGNPANFMLTNSNFLTTSFLYCTPQLFDVNQDGLLDLICGNKLGKISYYQNTGISTIPAFTLINNFWGGVSVIDSSSSIYGYSYPFIYDKNGSLELLVGSERGFIYRYGNISGNLNGTFTLLDTMYGNINEPIHATVTGTDINGDGTLDLAVGNYAGGLTIYTQSPTGIPESNLQEEFLEAFPNPNRGSFNIRLNISKATEAKMSLQNMIGQYVFERNLKFIKELNSFKVDLNNIDNGIYLFKLITEDGTYTKKIVIQK